MSNWATLIGLGGTIAWDDTEKRMLGAEELASRSECKFDRCLDIASVPSYELDVPRMAEVARVAVEAVEGGARAVVVTTGTDTLEELAWSCELLATRKTLGRACVVVTGAMRFLDHQESDGLANLRAATSIAMSRGASEYGVRVAFGGEIFGPRGLRKLDASSLQPFGGAPASRFPALPPVSDFALETNVIVRKVGPIPWDPVSTDIAGLVLEGLGAAHIPSRAFPVIEDMQGRSKPVVLASRSRSWFRRVSNEPWILEAGDLTAEQAAICLMVGLRREAGWEALRSWWQGLIDRG